MKIFFFLICLVLNLTWIPISSADDNTCWLSAGSQEDVWVIVYDSDDEGDFGDIIWQGKIPAGEKIKISSTDGHIRYQYKMKAHEGYEGDISADCYEQLTILVD
jgi:hypothetical protein